MGYGDSDEATPAAVAEEPEVKTGPPVVTVKPDTCTECGAPGWVVDGTEVGGDVSASQRYKDKAVTAGRKLAQANVPCKLLVVDEHGQEVESKVFRQPRLAEGD